MRGVSRKAVVGRHREGKRGNDRGEIVFVYVCGSWLSGSLFIELRLLPVSGAVPSSQERVGALGEEGGAGIQ